MVEPSTVIIPIATEVGKMAWDWDGIACSATVKNGDYKGQYETCPMEKATYVIWTEEGTGKVYFYAYDKYNTAKIYFDKWNCSRLLFDAEGKELEAAGMALARNTIREAAREFIKNVIIPKIFLDIDAYGQKGWILGGDFVRRDDVSCYVHLLGDLKSKATWKFESAGDHVYYIVFDEVGHKQRGWRLTAHRYYKEDERDTESTYVCVHKDEKQGQKWKLAPVPKTEHQVYITLADDAYSQKGWRLTAHRNYDKDKKETNSTPVCLHKNEKDGQVWAIQNMVKNQ